MTSAPRPAPRVPATAAGLPDAADVATAAQLACLLEATAPKPGNVSPGRHFADARYEDFLASAAAIGAPLAGAGGRALGATVRLAVESTARWTRSNTNLGIVLLLAPLARAALQSGVQGPPAAFAEASASAEASAPKEGGPHVTPEGGPHVPSSGSGPGDDPSRRLTPMRLRAAVGHVLAETDVDDAREVYAAIRIAAPGGLGKAEAQDVGDQPTMTLVEVMRLAADRDGIAREYATEFEVTFGQGSPALERARADGLCWDDAVIETFLTLLAATPDTHVARRSGPSAAADVSSRARHALHAGGVRSAAGRRAIDEMDLALRDAGNTRNPGTTADLTAAAIFVVLLAGGWHRAGVIK